MQTGLDYFIKDNHCEKVIEDFKILIFVPEWLAQYSAFFDFVSIKTRGLLSIYIPFLIVFYFILLEFSAQGQFSDSVSYFIKNGKVNHVDCTEYYINRGQRLNFYHNELDELCFRNITADGSEYSYGKVSEIQIKETKENKCKVENISFCWNFYNSYDNESGYATVCIKRINLLYGVEFFVKIKVDNKKNFIEFYGYTNEGNSENDISIDSDEICMLPYEIKN